mmetsp:Transcript_11473/g.16829  ORF Transcript_11473/g.16829 Transcript_11473/m.16829 type:complete len:201 (-) Transcript_11473:139-741(-)
MMTSLALDDQGGRCLQRTTDLSVALNKESGVLEVGMGDVDGSEVHFLRKQSSSSGQEESEDSSSDGLLQDGVQVPTSWTCTSKQQCRMSSASQPWNIQRVVWEKQEASEGSTDMVLNSGHVATTCSSRPYSTWISGGCSGANNDSNELVLAFGVAAHRTGTVQCITRYYNSVTGKLKRVALQYGKLLDDDNADEFSDTEE